MPRTPFARIALLTLIFAAATVSTASAATATVMPSALDARTFGASNGGWAPTVGYNGLVCIPGVTCPSANPSFQATSGSMGVGDGYVRASFGTLLGVLSTTTISWTSPGFTAPSGTDTASLSLAIRPQIASLLAIGSVKLDLRLVDVATPADSTQVATVPVTAASGGFGPVQATVDPSDVVAGRTYKIQIDTSVTTAISAVTSGTLDIDDVALTFIDLTLPTGLTAAGNGASVAGSVDPHGTTTSVSVDYGTTTSYGTSTTPVVVSGSGAQQFDIPLTGLTPGVTYHYRTTATNDDGDAVTTDDTFVAASPPAAIPPTVSGADNSRQRTVTFALDGSIVSADIEVLDAGAHVVDTVSDTGTDGSVAIELPATDGTYGVRVVRVNHAALSSTSTSVPALLDRAAPDAGPAPAVSGAPDALLVSFQRAPDVAAASVEVRDASGAVVLSVAVDGDHATIDLPDAPGVYTIRVVLSDAAGNAATTPGTQVTRVAAQQPPVKPDEGPKTTTSTPPPSPSPSSGAVLAPSANGRARVSTTNQVTLPLSCPTGEVCTVSGSLTFSASALSSRVHASAAATKVLARFSKVTVRGDRVRSLKLHLPAGFVRAAQKAGLRSVRATLTIKTTLAGGATSTKTRRISLRIPRAAKQEPAAQPKFTG